MAKKIRKNMPHPEDEPEVTYTRNGEPVAPYNRPKGFKVKRELTQGIKSISSLGTCIFTAMSELIEMELPSEYSQTGKAAAVCIDVHDELSGENFTLALNTVAASSLKRAGTPLVGRHFEVSVGGTEDGKRYRHTEVCELEGE